MDLTSERKAHIDAKSYEDLLAHSRFAPIGDPWFEGETGDYWRKRMNDLRRRDPDGAVAASKRLGWDR